MMELNNDEIKCCSCKCRPVCKEVDNWTNYVKEIQELRNKCSLFDDKVKCPYYVADENTVSRSIVDKEQVDDMRKKALDKSKVFYIEPCSYTRGFVNDNGVYKAKKLSEEDVAKVLEDILNCGF